MRVELQAARVRDYLDVVEADAGRRSRRRRSNECVPRVRRATRR
jgi:hypothetical protein